VKATVLVGDVLTRLAQLADNSVQCVVTSPPYWGLRDYGVDGQLGMESSPYEYIAKLVGIFHEVRRVLCGDGTLWCNMGDCYASGDKGGYARNRVTASDSMQASNLGDNFIGAPNRQWGGLPPKNLIGMPWRLAFALQADGWYLRQDIVWAKPNPMPESVTDRCTKSHEYLFLLTKSARYYYDQNAILENCSPATHDRLSQNVQAQIGSERAHAGGKTNGNMKAVARHLPGNKTHKGTTAYENGDKRMRTKAGLVDYAVRVRKLAEAGSGTKNNDSFDAAMSIMPEKRNKRSVWTITTQPYSEAHFATFPEALVEPCILAGSKEGDMVLDPFCGSGTTGAVALRYQREFVGIELNPAYAELSRKRIGAEAPMFNDVSVLAPDSAYPWSPAGPTSPTPAPSSTVSPQSSADRRQPQ